ncbi:MAG: Ig-like domain-containing protein [Acidobacteria bacterium]|nr:Ig-like domain-containing protein [Acidobacteriota bacterium]
MAAQTLPTATNAAALAEFPTFFQGKPILVRGDIVSTADRATFTDDNVERPLRLASGRLTLDSGRQQIRGTFWDVGRLTSDDPRVSPAVRTAIADFGEQWPRPGEALVIDVDALAPADPFPAPTIRAIALEPQRYLDQRVTIRGQFRGRNLFGDLPAAPAVSRWDFVLRSADAALWVTQIRPRGKNFDLDINARIDTNRWLEVSGVVRRRGGMVWIDGQLVELTQAAPESAPPASPAPPPQGPPASVVFTLPTQGETDVDANLTVKLQLSRDVDPKTIVDRVKVSYAGGPGDVGAAIAFQVSHATGSRVLEIRFKAPLERFRTVVVEVLEGMKTPDGAPVEPYKLMFTVGS